MKKIRSTVNKCGGRDGGCSIVILPTYIKDVKTKSLSDAVSLKKAA
jgi:hypothetical protein